MPLIIHFISCIALIPLGNPENSVVSVYYQYHWELILTNSLLIDHPPNRILRMYPIWIDLPENFNLTDCSFKVNHVICINMIVCKIKNLLTVTFNIINFSEIKNLLQIICAVLCIYCTCIYCLSIYLLVYLHLFTAC